MASGGVVTFLPIQAEGTPSLENPIPVYPALYIDGIGAVYGGELNTSTGVLKRRWVNRRIGEMGNTAPNPSSSEPWNHRFTLRGKWINNQYDFQTYVQWMSDGVPHGNADKNSKGSGIAPGSFVLYVYDDTVSTTIEFAQKYSDTQLVYQVKESLSDVYHLTASQLQQAIQQLGLQMPSALEMRRRVMMGRKTLLPSAYQQIEYLESSGVQFIETNYVPVIGDEVTFTFKSKLNSSVGKSPFFAYGGKDPTFGIVQAGGRLYFSYFGSGNAPYVTPDLQDREWHTVSLMQDGSLIIDDETAGTDTRVRKELDGENKVISLFARANANNRSWFNGMISQLFIKNNGRTKINLIPCIRKSDSEPGMYDTVSKTFFTNAGTGDFIIPT